MSSEQPKHIDFDVLSEPWNKYELNDNTILKTRYILTRLFRIVHDDKPSYTFEGQTLNVAIIPAELHGLPDKTVYSPDELSKSVIKDYVEYKTMLEEWNDYYVYDGTRLRLKMTVSGVKKTAKYDVNGDPIYLVETNIAIIPRKPEIN